MNQIAKSCLRFSMLAATVCLMADPASAQSNRKLMRTGNKFFDKENYREAIPFYEKVLTNEPNNPKALYFAGISYITFDKERAADYLYRVQKLKPNVDNDLQYWLGRVDHINYRFDSAIDHYQTYSKTIKKRNLDRLDEVAQLIQYSKNAKRETANPKDVFVKNLGGTINTIYSEHSPVISQDYNYLLFTSRAENVTGGREAKDGEYFEDIFETTRIGEDEWEKTRVVPGALNSPVHDASIQLLDNGTKMMLYRSENNGDIMISERQPDGQWGAPKSIGANINSNNFESDAFMTPDGQTLYFSTSNYSENGDLDIYVSQRQKNGEWGKPRNLGKTINTIFDDDSPFLGKDGTLYFASRGHNSMGGYDIFAAKYDSVARRFAKPVNLGSPINTPDDDTYYRLAPDGSYAYLSSYRIGGYGEKDIYTINYIRPARVKGKVLSSIDSTEVPGVELVFNGLQADKRPISYRDVSKPDSANFDLHVLSGRPYQVQISIDNQVVKTEQFDVPVVLDDTTTVRHNFYIEYAGTPSIAANPLTDVATAGTAASAKYTFKNLYFDTDKYSLRPESVNELDRLVKYLKANPSVNISIEGHTDSRASDQYNQALGQNRADAAFEYLQKQGISPKRMVTVTYGERRPAVPNTSAENMQLNRRTIFKVLPREDATPKQ